MTDARMKRTYEDRETARDFLDQASSFRADADLPGLSAESQSVLLHNAAMCACDAILQFCGLRVAPGDSGHVVRLKNALEQLDGDTEDLYDSLDVSRFWRNEASYAAAWVPEPILADAREATIELLERARALIGERRT